MRTVLYKSHKAGLAFIIAVWLTALFAALPIQAQDETGQVQLIHGNLEPGEHSAYLLRAMQPGDRISIQMQTISGDLDPAIGIIDARRALADVEAEYTAEIERLVASDDDIAQGLTEVRNRIFLAWDDDGGEGYSAALEYTVPTAGDYRIIASGALSALGRSTSGDYELIIGRNAPIDATQPTGAPFVEKEQTATALTAVIEEARGSLSPGQPKTTLQLVDVEAGETLYISADPTSGNLIPTLILRDYGGKAVQASNLDGQEPRAALTYTFDERGSGYTLEVDAAAAPDGSESAGDFRVLLGRNAPEALTGQAEATGDGVLKKPIEVKLGLRIERISEVDSQGEDFTVLGSIRMDWLDPTLAFSPDECGCAMKIYTEKEFDRFLADTQSRWPDFVFFNQQGNRWTQSRAAVIWPDGRARYGETFTVTYQGDFDFRQFPFDTQTFPIYVDQLFPADTYVSTDLSGFSAINPDHGEDEFIISDFTTGTELVAGRVADNPVSRFTFSFDAPRHQEYYVLQIFVPVLLIMLISWFTFFLRDYTRRIEASAANILLFIAFSFSLTDNYPRLGYLTFLDAVMAVTFIFNALVLLYNVFMKRLELAGGSERFESIDKFFDWAYPLIYLGLIGIVALLFFT